MYLGITFVVQIIYDEMVQNDSGKEGEAGEDPGLYPDMMNEGPGNTEHEVERHAPC